MHTMTDSAFLVTLSFHPLNPQAEAVMGCTSTFAYTTNNIKNSSGGRDLKALSHDGFSHFVCSNLSTELNSAMAHPSLYEEAEQSLISLVQNWTKTLCGSF